MHMNVTHFEFTRDLLLVMAYHCFSNKYFEFLQPQPDPEKDKTSSIDFISIFSTLKKEDFINKLYMKNNQNPLSFNPMDLRYWKEYFGRFDPIISK